MVQRAAEPPLAVINFVLEWHKAQTRDDSLYNLGAPATPGVEVARQHYRAIMMLNHGRGLVQLPLHVLHTEGEINDVNVHDEQGLDGVGQRILGDQRRFASTQPWLERNEFAFGKRCNAAHRQHARHRRQKTEALGE